MPLSDFARLEAAEQNVFELRFRKMITNEFTGSLSRDRARIVADLPRVRKLNADLRNEVYFVKRLRAKMLSDLALLESSGPGR
jgi:hypothetical protein